MKSLLLFNHPESSEIISASLYDIQTIQPEGAARMTFFQAPSGRDGRTLMDTNMILPGALPAGQSFLVESIEAVLFTGRRREAESFYFGGGLELCILQKRYVYEAPLFRFIPSRLPCDAETKSGQSGYLLHHKISIQPAVHFVVNVDIPEHFAPREPVRFGVYLKGKLMRPIA